MTTDHSTQDTATTAQGNRPRLSPIRIGFLCDVLGTAVEGGIGYWSHVLRGERGVPAGTPGWEGADMAALAWTSVTVVDSRTTSSCTPSPSPGWHGHSTR